MSDLKDDFDEKAKTMSQATGWLLDMMLLDNDHMKNAMVLNILKVSHHIRHAEILIDSNKKKMLILMELSGFGKLFHKRQLSSAVLNMIQEVLPSFELRVILDRALFEKAVSMAQAHSAGSVNGK